MRQGNALFKDKIEHGCCSIRDTNNSRQSEVKIMVTGYTGTEAKKVDRKSGKEKGKKAHHA